MKKFTWIAALFVALALIVTGCPGGGDPEKERTDDDGDNSATGLFLAATEGGTAVPNKTITTTNANQNVYVYFDPLGKNFEKIVFNFTASPGENLTITALYGSHDEDSCTWGKSTWDTSWYENGPIDIISTAFPADWSSTGASGIDNATIFGFCVNIANETTFTLTSVTFVGVGADPVDPPPITQPPADKPIQIDFNGTNKSAVVKGSQFVTVSEGTITVAWNPEGSDNGEFRVKIELDAGFDISSGYSKFVMDWTAGSASGGSFNISLYFPGNRMLSAYANSGTAGFDFTDDHPNWAAGTDWGGASVGTITGFEIFSADDTNFGSDALVITGLSFE